MREMIGSPMPDPPSSLDQSPRDHGSKKSMLPASFPGFENFMIMVLSSESMDQIVFSPFESAAMQFFRSS